MLLMPKISEQYSMLELINIMKINLKLFLVNIKKCEVAAAIL